MTTGQKVGLGIGATGFILWWLARPTIKTIFTDAQERAVSFYMAVNGKSIKDTFYLGDPPQLIAAGDGEHYFYSNGNATLGTVQLSIGYLAPNGGFKAIDTLLIQF